MIFRCLQVSQLFNGIVCVLVSEEIVDDPFSFDADESYSSLSEVEKLERVTQSDQCFIRYIVDSIMLLNTENP